MLTCHAQHDSAWLGEDLDLKIKWTEILFASCFALLCLKWSKFYELSFNKGLLFLSRWSSSLGGHDLIQVDLDVVDAGAQGLTNVGAQVLFVQTQQRWTGPVHYRSCFWAQSTVRQRGQVFFKKIRSSWALTVKLLPILTGKHLLKEHSYMRLRSFLMFCCILYESFKSACFFLL